MKAWLLERMGDGIGKLRFTEVADPTPGPGQAVVELRYAGLNPADRYLAENQYPAKPIFPHVLGRDGMGSVSAIGDGVTSVRAGDRVTIVTGECGINLPGTFAGKVLANADWLAPVPLGWTDEQSAAAPLVYITAFQAIDQWRGTLPERAVVLITGASGGVGVASVQVAKSMGHTVVALSRRTEKAAKLREFGADFTFDPNDPGWTRALKDQLGKRRVDLAIDNIGGTLFSEVIGTLGNRGKVSCVGRLAGPVPEFNTATLFFRRIQLGGVAVHTYSTAEARGAWARVLELLGRSNTRPAVDSVHEFERLADAFAALERGPMGKVLLRIG